MTTIPSNGNALNNAQMVITRTAIPGSSITVRAECIASAMIGRKVRWVTSHPVQAAIAPANSAPTAAATFRRHWCRPSRP